MKGAMRQKLGPAQFLGAPVATNEVAITFDRRNPFARYPASEDDLRAVLRRLPIGVLDGLNGISVSLGAAYRRDTAEEWKEQDPVVGRFGDEHVPGVYGGLILGVYVGHARRSQVSGFVSAKPLEGPWALYLLLRMLSTLVHEVAHHDDMTKGRARDRWLGDDEHRTEWYAESRQLLWVETVVIPYLQETYPAEVALLEDWMRLHIGLVLPMRVLAGDARLHDKKHGTYLWRNGFQSRNSAFEAFARAIDAAQDITEARLGRATGLHRAGELEHAQDIGALILATQPDHVPALVQKGWICRKQKRYEEAHVALQRANQVKPANRKVWQSLARLYFDTGAWVLVLIATTEAIKTASDPLIRPAMALLQGRAYIGLAKFDEAR
jgi:tetratricopeptide (TPR) repeat protein